MSKIARSLIFRLLFSVFLLTSITSASVSATDFERLIILANETRAVCRLGEAGHPPVEAACATRDIYVKALRDGGYCYNVAEQTWVRCN